MSAHITVSTVTPVYKGEAFLGELVRQLEALRDQFQRGNIPVRLVESIFVLDDPIDDSETVLQELMQGRDWIRVVTLSRNFGQHPATLAGIMYSCGDWIATLDEDMQHRPSAIPELLIKAVRDGCDLVYGVPLRPPHFSVFRNMASRLIKRVLSFIGDQSAAASFSSFRFIRGPMARASASLAGHSSYLDIALGWFTTRVTAIATECQDPRHASESGYTLGKLVAHAQRMFMASELRILSWVSYFSVFSIVLAGLGFLIVVGLRVVAPGEVAVQGWASLMSAILFYGGSALLVGTVVLTFLINVYQQSIGKPSFFVVDRSRDRAILEALKDDAPL